MASIISTGEMGKRKVEAIKKALGIVENLDMDNFAFCVDSLKRKVGDLEKSMVELKALQEQAAGGI